MRARKKPEPYSNGDCRLGRRGARYVVEFPDAGTRKRVRLKAGISYDQAKAEVDRFAEARRAVKKQQQSHTIGDLWTMWLADRAGDGFSNDIYNANWVSLKPVFAHRAPHLLKKDDWRAYARARFELGRSSWTVNTELSRLKACLQWAVDNKHLSEMTVWWIPSRGKPRSRVLTLEEARRLLESAAEHSDPHIYLFIVLALSTAARHTAILDLTWDRVNFQTGEVTYDTSEPVEPMSKSWRKGRATVIMGRLLREALEHAYEGRQSEYVIEHGGRRLKTVKEGFAAAVKRAGLSKGISPHTLRHTVSTWLKVDGVGLELRAQLLGHADSRTTDIVYSHAGAEILKPAIESLDDALPHVSRNRRQKPVVKRVKKVRLVPMGQRHE